MKEYYYKECTEDDDYIVALGKPLEDVLEDLNVKDKVINELATINAQLSFKLKMKEVEDENKVN